MLDSSPSAEISSQKYIQLGNKGPLNKLDGLKRLSDMWRRLRVDDSAPSDADLIHQEKIGDSSFELGEPLCLEAGTWLEEPRGKLYKSLIRSYRTKDSEKHKIAGKVCADLLAFLEEPDRRENDDYIFYLPEEVFHYLNFDTVDSVLKDRLKQAILQRWFRLYSNRVTRAKADASDFTDQSLWSSGELFPTLMASDMLNEQDLMRIIKYGHGNESDEPFNAKEMTYEEWSKLDVSAKVGINHELGSKEIEDLKAVIETLIKKNLISEEFLQSVFDLNNLQVQIFLADIFLGLDADKCEDYKIFIEDKIISLISLENFKRSKDYKLRKINLDLLFKFTGTSFYSGDRARQLFLDFAHDPHPEDYDFGLSSNISMFLIRLFADSNATMTFSDFTSIIKALDKTSSVPIHAFESILEPLALQDFPLERVTELTADDWIQAYEDKSGLVSAFFKEDEETGESENVNLTMREIATEKWLPFFSRALKPYEKNKLKVFLLQEGIPIPLDFDHEAVVRKPYPKYLGENDPAIKDAQPALYRPFPILELTEPEIQIKRVRVLSEAFRDTLNSEKYNNPDGAICPAVLLGGSVVKGYAEAESDLDWAFYVASDTFPNSQGFNSFCSPEREKLVHEFINDVKLSAEGKNVKLCDHPTVVFVSDFDPAKLKFLGATAELDASSISLLPVVTRGQPITFQNKQDDGEGAIDQEKIKEISESVLRNGLSEDYVTRLKVSTDAWNMNTQSSLRISEPTLRNIRSAFFRNCRNFHIIHNLFTKGLPRIFNESDQRSSDALGLASLVYLVTDYDPTRLAKSN